MTIIPINTESHPCFGPGSRQTHGRVHLPVAPRAVARGRFAPDAPLGTVMHPMSALEWLGKVIEGGTPVDVVGITGPGDPLATPDVSLQALALVRDKYPEMNLCLTTMGFGAEAAAADLAKLGLSHVTVLVDAVTPAVAEKLYAWIRPGNRTIALRDAVHVLMTEQAKAIAALAKAGLVVKVNTTVYPGINDDQIERLAAAVSRMGATVMRLVPHKPPEEPAAGDPGAPSTELMVRLNDLAAKHLAVAAYEPACGAGLVGLEPGADAARPGPTKDRPNLAVCSSNGFDVDLHLGQAAFYLIYGPKHGPVELLERRPAPEPGGGNSRWAKAAETLADCFAVLAIAAGETPRSVLAENGLRVVLGQGDITGLVDTLYGGGKKGKKGGKGRQA